MLTISYKELEAAGLLDDMHNPTFTTDEIPKIFLLLKRTEVIQAYATMTGMTADEIEHTYEGGINDWIGFGSVTCYELGGHTLAGYGFNEIQLAIG